MISFLKRYKYQSELKSHSNHSFRQEIMPLNTGAKVGIVSHFDHRQKVENFVKSVVDPGATLAVLYYCDTNEPGADSYSKKEVSWYGVPKSEIVSDFLSREYDRLFFIDTNMSSHQQFICQLAKARFSVGPLLTESDFSFDLSIQIKNITIDQLVKEMKKGIDLLSNIS